MLIVKIGGGAAINVAGVVDDLAALSEQTVLVHGANAARDRLACALSRPTRVVTSASGYTSVFSDDDAIDLLMMAYAGLRNKRIVELCQARGVNAVGLSGLDGRAVQGRRNSGIRVRDGGKTLLLRDNSGKPTGVNVPLLRLLLDNGYVPVLTVPIADEDGRAVNSENDDIVAALARALGCGRVVQLIEAPGLLADPADPKSVVPRVRPDELAGWEERSEGRFKRKVAGLRKLCADGGPEVVIADGRGPHPLADALAARGTVIA
ncbi:MAG TPA: [LysW]-aminoadipate kinase [Thermoanaerobaculaceae bacterium]|nr:[LysW]-aminoadipate kinase [Thermoanaerobaculaceae bacterium]